MKHKHIHKHNPQHGISRSPEPSDSNYGPYVDYDKIEGIKFVESLRGKYPKSEWWIIGNDPNLDCYPDDFFDKKLSITLNFACIGFPNSTYFCTSHTVVSEGIVSKLGTDYLNKCIFVALCRDYRDPISNIWWEDYGLDPIYAKVINKHYSKIDDDDRERMMRQVSSEGIFELVGGFGVVDHAMQIAMLLGAKRIILIGCSNKGGKIFYYAQKRGMSEFYRDEEWQKKEPERHEQYRTGTVTNIVDKRREMATFIRLFKKHGIEVVKHRFDEKKERFVFEEMEEWNG